MVIYDEVTVGAKALTTDREQALEQRWKAEAEPWT